MMKLPRVGVEYGTDWGITQILDPIAWNLARYEYIEVLKSDEEIVSLDHGSTYYWTRDLQELWELRRSASSARRSGLNRGYFLGLFCSFSKTRVSIILDVFEGTIPVSALFLCLEHAGSS